MKGLIINLVIEFLELEIDTFAAYIVTNAPESTTFEYAKKLAEKIILQTKETLIKESESEG